MKNREQMREVLANQMRIWSAKPFGQLIEELREPKAYQVEADSGIYQVEVDLLENTDEYIQVGIAVDDVCFLSSMFPACGSFVLNKGTTPAAPSAEAEGSEES